MIQLLRNTARNIAMGLRIAWIRLLYRHDIHPTAKVSFSAFLDKTAPGLISIGEYSIVTRGAIVLTHDFARSLHAPTTIGSFCLIGANAIVLPGVVIGDHCVVGAGAVVVRDVPTGSVVVGNPARVVRSIQTSAYGKITGDR